MSEQVVKHRTKEQCPACGKEWSCEWSVHPGADAPEDGAATRFGGICYDCSDSLGLRAKKAKEEQLGKLS